MKKTLYIAADHAGFPMKEVLIPFLTKKGYDVKDLGAYTLVLRDDYPQYAHALAKQIAHTPHTRGILLCGSGQGVCIAANRTKGIRATLAWSEESARLSRTDDDANVLCLPARLISAATAKKIITTWLDTKFSGAARHTRRIAQIDASHTKHTPSY